MDTYEKKYKDALSRARSMYETQDDAELAAYIFPELRESEDERVIRDIHDLLVNACEADRRYPELLAWLEKQKERGPLTKEEEYILHRIIEYLEDETCPSEWINLLHDIYCLPYEKQKEQKPAEKSEIPINLDLEIGKYISERWSLNGLNPLTPVYLYDFTVDELKECARHFYELGRNSKPAEWSDYKDKIDIPYCSSEPEWSEEDEKMLARIIERGQSQIQMFETGLLPEHIAWLKSLRPQKKEDLPKWLIDNDYNEKIDGKDFSLHSVGLAYRGYYIPYSDLLKLPKEDEK